MSIIDRLSKHIPLRSPASPSRGAAGPKGFSLAGLDFNPAKMLGQGGFADVHEVIYRGQPAALKIVRDPAHNGLAELEHKKLLDLGDQSPHIVKILYGGPCSRTKLYGLVMEKLAGPTLKQALAVHKKLPPLLATEIILQLANGLYAAKRQSITHGDIKPDNVFLEKDGSSGLRAVITDFGAGKNICADQVDRSFAGTPPYLAPDAATDPDVMSALRDPNGVRPTQCLDQFAQMDIFSLGVMYYEMLAGEKPFKGPVALKEVQDNFPEIASDLETYFVDPKEPHLLFKPEIENIIGQSTLAEPVKQKILALSRRPLLADDPALRSNSIDDFFQAYAAIVKTQLNNLDQKDIPDELFAVIRRMLADRLSRYRDYNGGASHATYNMIKPLNADLLAAKADLEKSGRYEPASTAFERITKRTPPPAPYNPQNFQPTIGLNSIDLKEIMQDPLKNLNPKTLAVSPAAVLQDLNILAINREEYKDKAKAKKLYPIVTDLIAALNNKAAQTPLSPDEQKIYFLLFCFYVDLRGR